MEKIKTEENRDSYNVFFAVILETALLQLKILDCCSKLREQQISLEGASCFNSQTFKIMKERTDLIEILQRTLLDIVLFGKWNRLLQTVNNLTMKLSAENSLMYSHRELKSTRENIISEMQTSSEQHETLLRLADKKIAMLKDLLEDNMVNAASVIVYSEKWLDARSQVLNLKESTLCKRLPNIQHEQRVHEELDKAFQVQIKELESNIDYWKAKYAEDITDIKKRVADTKEKLKITTGRREAMQQLFNLHAGEMRAWITFKTEKAARLAREKLTLESAIKIQSWWRGVMVRKGFGAFRYLRNVKKSPSKSKKK